MAFRLDLRVTDSMNVLVLLLLFLQWLRSDSHSYLLLSLSDSAVISGDSFNTTLEMRFHPRHEYC